MACPVCGAPDGTCKPGDPPNVRVVRDVDFSRDMEGNITMDARHRYRLESSRWRSLYDVVVQTGKRTFERRYARRDYIPLVEALKQEQVVPGQVTEADEEELRRHVAGGRVTLDQVKEALELAKKQKKPKNRMVGSGQVVQKAMDDDAKDLLEGVE